MLAGIITFKANRQRWDNLTGVDLLFGISDLGGLELAGPFQMLD